MNIASLKFDENGLIPAIVQDFNTKQILTMAYMNKESIEITLKENLTCFYSRSRKEIWRKGSTSGNTQHLISITSDCDNDCLLINVIPNGPACHNGTQTCFVNDVYSTSTPNSNVTKFSISDIYNIIMERKLQKKENSYTTYLFEKGIDKILKKVGEESAEVIIAAKNNNNEELIAELSDLVYHSLVLMVEKEVIPKDLLGELSKRYTNNKEV